MNLGLILQITQGGLRKSIRIGRGGVVTTWGLIFDKFPPLLFESRVNCVFQNLRHVFILHLVVNNLNNPSIGTAKTEILGKNPVHGNYSSKASG